MKKIREKFQKKHAFTIVELLTVMAIIIILIGLLVPSLNMVRRYALYVKQRNQLSAIGKAIEFYNVQRDGYPDSSAFDPVPLPYCGAMKLCEAMVGQDLLGFHPNSHFFQTGTTDGAASTCGVTELYPSRGIPGSSLVSMAPRCAADPILIQTSMRERQDLYLTLESANAYRLGEIYNAANLSSFNLPPAIPVLCDVYNRLTNIATGKNIGMPILYYKANISNTIHDANFPNLSIYNSADNQILIDLPLPWDPFSNHPMATFGTTPDGTPVSGPSLFYQKTRNPAIELPSRPYKADSFILMSAGFDGLYGTKDDVFDFEK